MTSPKALLPALSLTLCLGACCLVSPARADDDDNAKAVQAGLSITSELYSNLRGGLKRGSTGLTNIYASLQGNGGALWGMPGLTLFTQGLLVRGGDPSALTGDAQGASNIAASHLNRLYEAWAQYNSDDSRWSVLGGLYDVNSEFDRLNSASLFLNSSFGMDPSLAGSGPAGPSIFPATSVGVRVDYKPFKNVVWRTALLDDTPVYRDGAPDGPFAQNDGLLWISEWAWLDRAQSGEPPKDWQPDMVGRVSSLAPYDNKLAVGLWGYTHSQAALDGGNNARSSGLYVLLDRRLYVSSKLPGQVLGGFVQGAVANPQTNRFARYLGLGLTLTQPFSQRPDDTAGIALALARNSRHYRPEGNTDDFGATEAAWELSYQAAVNSWLSIQPDLQYIAHPDSRRDIGNALAFQLSVQVNL
ncbi:MAG: carbohydrate porin [Pseudomonadota bacterium]|uniref:carbohydrate porin n=1 Tax=Gallaecimonas pentaromativorans TaxID=584787 RepID=UPI0009F97F0A|nr:carbohydrate porin [Gallaecimonas pentaromativorans]MED5526325.1 carbohydrate porin [Pseudomonadota bacterium]